MNDIRPVYRQRSLFGPLLIAAIGILFLLRNFGVISSRNFGWWFARYWPLLLIFWGVVKFAEYQWARQHNRPYSGVGAGGVVFVVFLVLFGLGATGVSRINFGWHGDPDMDWGWGIFGYRYDFTQSFAQPITAASQIKILSERGDITISPSPDDQAHVVIHKSVRDDSQKEANDFNNSTTAKFEQQGSVWLLDLSGGRFEEGRFDVVLQVPPKYPVSVDARHGNLRVSQMEAGVELEASNGGIDTEQIHGNVLLHTHRNDVSVTDVTGDVNIDGDVGDSKVSDVTGAVSFNTSNCTGLDLSHIAGTVHFRSSRTDMQFSKLTGDLTMEGGDLRASSIVGPFTLKTREKEVDLDEVTGSVHIEDTRGNIEVQTQAPLGNVDIGTTEGQISISLPDTAGFQIDAESDTGQIQSDYSLSVNNQSNNATASGTVGKGGPQVRLRTNRGTIQIHKAG